MKGNVIIISSPSGGGKGTLIRGIFNTIPNLSYSVSYTTRPARPGEQDGRDYFFVGPEEFREMTSRGDFLEYAEVHGNYYGTSRLQIEAETARGRDIILEIDVQGAASVLEKMPDSVSIFILPPSFEILRQRLLNRATEDRSAVDLRLKNSPGEVKRFELFEYVVVNREITAATGDLCSIILAERLKRIRQTDAIQDILDSFDVISETVSEFE